MENKSDLRPFNICDLFLEAAERFPDNVAIIEGNNPITYAQLKKDVLSVAAQFRKKGIAQGDRVLVFVPMSIELYKIVLAIFYMGATAIFLDEWVSMKRMEECCRLADCKGFIGIRKARLLRIFSKPLRSIPVLLDLSTLNVLAAENKALTSVTDTALITFTSGSTGKPKAAKRTHGFLLEQFRALNEKIQPKAGDIDITLLPVVLLVNLAAGATSVIVRTGKAAAFSPSALFDAAKKHSVTRLTCSPFIVNGLAEYMLSAGKALPVLKQIFTGGAPVFPEEARLYLKAFAETDVCVVYGSTEAEPVSSVNAKELANDSVMNEKGLLVGKIWHQSDVRIIPITEQSISVKSEADLKTCPVLVPGEIIVAGPHVLKEYFHNEEAMVKNKIPAGDKLFHRTGDSGFIDEEGRLYLTGRCSGVFIYNNLQVFPFLYERIFRRMSGISMGTVLFINGKVLFALEVKKNTSHEEISGEFNKLLLRPHKIVFLKSIPRDPRHNSRIDYNALKLLIRD